jgi:hypothetical protein
LISALVKVMLCARAPLAASMRTPNAIIHEKNFVIGLPPRFTPADRLMSPDLANS